MGYVKGYAYKKSAKKPYLAQISFNGRTHGLGSYVTAREARATYFKALDKGVKTVRKRTSSKPWMDEDKDELLRLYETTNLSQREIGEALGRSEQSIYHMLRRLREGR
jgi:hypothetical protein